MRLKIASALVAGVLMVACATPYQQNSLGGGYTDEQLDETHYRVKFSGNGYATSDRVWAFWMYRCAELTKEKGYTHFSLHKPGEPLARLNREEPARAGFRTAVYREGEGGASMQKTRGVVVVPSYIYTPGVRVTTYHSDAVVSLHRTPLAEGLVLLKAQTVLDELAPYVKSGGQAALIKRDELFDKASTYVQPQIGYRFGGEL
jgi:hypothetical protein